MKTIALIAHDKKKDEMIDFVNNHQDLLGKYHLIATRRPADWRLDRY